MIETRDIRLSDVELAACEWALRDEIKKRTRSIKTAEAARAAGRRVQNNVLQEHYDIRDAARSALTTVEVARKQIRHKQANAIRVKLGMEPLELNAG